MLQQTDAELMLSTMDVYNKPSNSEWQLDDIIDAPVAIAADTAASLYNSALGIYNTVTPDSMNVEYADGEKWAYALSEDAGDFYTNHTEAVKLGSFAAGLFIPGAIVSKSLTLAKAGKMGLLGKPFAALEQAKVANTALALDTARKEGEAALQVSKAMSSLKWNSMATGAAEGLAYETGAMLLYNGHSYMQQDYDATDFAIGVGLGTLVGPLRYLMAKGEIKTAMHAMSTEQAAAIKDTASFTLLGATPGDTLNNYALSISNGKHTLGSAAAEDLSIQTKEKVVSHVNMARQDMDTVLQGMTDNALKTPASAARNEKLVPKGAITTWGVATTEDYLMHMAEAKPGIFSGVTKFKPFQRGTQSPSLYSNGIDVTKEGEVLIDSANDAIGGWLKSARISDPAQLKAIRDKADVGDVLFSRDELGTIVFDVQKNSTTAMEFMRATLSMPEFADTPVKVLGLDKSILKSLKQPAPVFDLDDELYLKAHTLESMKHLVRPNAVRGVIDPYIGTDIVPDTLGHLLVGAAADPAFKVSKNYKLTGAPKDYDPLTQSTMQVDKLFINAIAAIGRYKGIDALEIASTDIHRFQAAIIKGLENPNKFSITLDGANTITNLEQANKLLFDNKILAMKRMALEGHTLEVQAKKTNMPMDTARMVRDNGYRSFDPKDTAINMYTSGESKDIERYLSQKMIYVEGKDARFAKLEENRLVQRLDRETLRTAHQAIVENTVRSSGDGGLNALYDQLLNTPLTKTIRDTLEQPMSAFAADSTFIASTDHALRRLGKTGDYITSWGKAFNPIIIKEVKETVTTATDLFTPVVRNRVANVEAQEVFRALDAIPTARAKDLTYDPATGKIITAFTKVKDPVTGQLVKQPSEFLKYATDSKTDIVLKTNESKALMEGWGSVQAKMLNLTNSNRKLVGLPAIQPRGIWFPYDAIDDQFVGYLVNTRNDVKLVTAPTKELFDAKLLALRTEMPGYEQVIKPSAKTHPDVVSRGEAMSYWNDMHNHAALNHLDLADTSLSKRGVAAESISVDGARFDRMLGSLQRNMWRQYRGFAKNAASEIFDTLDKSAKIETEFTAKSAKGSLLQKMRTGVSGSELASSTMLNGSLMHKYPGMGLANDIYTAQFNRVAHKMSNLWDGAKSAAKYKTLSDVDKLDFEKLSADLAKAGVPNNLGTAYDFALSKQGGVKDVAQKDIAKASSVLATLNLRLFEWSHGAVTSLSTPILVGTEAAHSSQYPLKHMMAAAKMALKDPDGIMKRAKERGITKGIIAETTEMMDSMVVDKAWYNSPKAKKVIDMLSLPSDKAEAWSREFAYATGFQIAKSKSPGAPIELLEAEASAFMTRTMGNYTSRQRPVLFQGTLGATVGLYQTFMLTMAQNMMRYVEKGDKKAMMTLLGGQATVFGMESLPMYKPLNKMIGAYVSDDHDDISSTIYETFGDDNEQTRSVAEFMLYGVPAALTQVAIQTRAEIEPRLPLNFDGEVTFGPPLVTAIYDGLTQAKNTVSNVARAAVGGGGISDIYNAGMQGLASQYLWRPGARLAELALGYSTDRTGTVISRSEDVYQPWPIFARVMGSRPLQEQAVRSLKYSASYYSAIDRDRKEKAIHQVRQTISTEGSDEMIGDAFGKYMNAGGSATGWKQIVNGAYLSLDAPYATRLMERTEKLPAISNILDSYAY